MCFIKLQCPGLSGPQYYWLHQNTEHEKVAHAQWRSSVARIVYSFFYQSTFLRQKKSKCDVFVCDRLVCDSWTCLCCASCGPCTRPSRSTRAPPFCPRPRSVLRTDTLRRRRMRRMKSRRQMTRRPSSSRSLRRLRRPCLCLRLAATPETSGSKTPFIFPDGQTLHELNTVEVFCHSWSHLLCL